MPPGPGRPKGSANKVTSDLREAIRASFDRIGGANWLVKLSEEKPEVYAQLLGKTIPKEIEATITNAIPVIPVPGVAPEPPPAQP